MFTNQDRAFLEDMGITSQYLSWQIQSYENGFAPMDLVEAASVGRGILQPTNSDRLIALYEQSHADVIKFVPASGAASRMFKDLYAFVEKEQEPVGKLSDFFEKISLFAFYGSLCKALQAKGLDIESAIKQKKYKLIVETLLFDLGYGTLPKALLEFHSYPYHQARTPIEEHFVEGAAYARCGNEVKIHFTISPEHRERFIELVENKKPHYQQVLGVELLISYSEQKKSTDTLAVDLQNKPFRNSDGSLLLRPAGHGALLENLNDLDSELVFIKNIDNVVPQRLLDDTIRFKKLLAGVLIDVKNKVFGFLERLDCSQSLVVAEIESFYQNMLCEEFGSGYSTLSVEQKMEFLHRRLNRPIKVCGMVKNEGEPGGGPFWVRNKDGHISLQIVESAQVEMGNPIQASIMMSSSHFNPVDLVCWIKDYKGQKFDLRLFRDPDTGFISQKSKDGKELKALELPGLWNGAMADWNTVFVEVPLSTFNPVKTVFDLLRKEHTNH